MYWVTEGLMSFQVWIQVSEGLVMCIKYEVKAYIHLSVCPAQISYVIKILCFKERDSVTTWHAGLDTLYTLLPPAVHDRNCISNEHLPESVDNDGKKH